MKSLYRLTALILFAISLPFAAMAGMNANEVLTKASQKLNSAQSITAKFSGSVTGSLIVSGKKFAMDAGGFGIWYNGTDMWTYSKKAGETSLTTPTPSELVESNPMEIINSYSAKFTATKVSESGNKYTIKLTPKGKGNNVQTATLVINTSTWMPSSIDMVLTNDSRMTINITSIVEGKSLPANMFVYPESKYPGIEIVDLR